jgi:predicted GNAT family acetyltransferase
MTAADPHPLDRPVWNAVTGRQRGMAIGTPLAMRFRPEVNLFAAAADDSKAALDALSALCPAQGQIGLVETAAPPPIAGTRIAFQAELDQMVLEALSPGAVDLDWTRLGDDDAADMLALARLTKPGPFLAATHKLGDFVGVRREGLLVAMAGERMKPDGFTEVSAVATHPDWRGQGLAGALMRIVIGRILARGEAAFLHVYPDNPAVAMYQALGFRKRRSMVYTILER